MQKITKQTRSQSDLVSYCHNGFFEILLHLFQLILAYFIGGRRYTVQGLEGMSSHRSAPDIRDQRPVYNREESVPEDLMAVYRNMNREVIL